LTSGTRKRSAETSPMSHRPPLPRGGRWLMGLVSALLFLVPLVNLLAPIFSAAMAVHMLLGRKTRS